ncbi:phage holin family protein [Bernardetia sp.]|uniref:phage holin family protein n=1 Tax=Bernardetia sp. TaxID=1937974 RepID=UPI0025BE6976|nr:phage holin family protein [Bernardetia sp.]
MNKQKIIEQIKSYFGINALTKEVQIYIDLKREIVKTSVVDGSAKAIHGAIKGIGFLFLGLCIFLFLNLMLGFGISEWFFRGKYWTGFSILTGFYVLLAIIFAALQSMIKRKVEDGIEKGIKGTPLELKTIPQILYPNSETRKNIEKGIMKEDVRHEKVSPSLTEEEAKKALIEQVNEETEMLNEQIKKDIKGE